MGYDKRFGQRFFSGLLLSLGMALAACQSTETGAVMAIEEEGDQSRHIVRKIVGGVVMKVLYHPGRRSVALLIRETRLSRSGRPLCQAPTGRILSLGSVKALFQSDPGRLRSAMVVTGNPEPRSLTGLHPGDCVSVAPDEVGRGKTKVRPSILIETPALAREEDRFGKGIVEVWANLPPPRTMTAKVKKKPIPLRRTLSKASSSRALSLHELEQPA